MLLQKYPPPPILTDGFHGASVGEIVSHDLAELGKVPTVPFPAAHVVVVQLLIQVIQQSCQDQKKKDETLKYYYKS